MFSKSLQAKASRVRGSTGLLFFFPILCKSSSWTSSRSLSPSSLSSQIRSISSVGHSIDETEHTTQSPTKISVDRSGLYNPPEHCHEDQRSESALTRHLKGLIKFRGGPISVAEYMEEVLTNPTAGYYINQDVFGKGGDFVTSPDVSQMFGEMIGIWAVCLWQSMGQPNAINLVELGPGRGTLMADLLRGVSKFNDFVESLNIHLVECSPVLRKLQHQTLKCEDQETTGNNCGRTVSALVGAPVSWHAVMEQVPTGSPTIIIAHEFYDALPVHQFQKTSRGWCEKMVDIGEDSSFRFVLSSQPTPAVVYLKKRLKWAGAEDIAKLNHAEVCPKAMELTEAISRRVSSDGGGALVIDYGLNGLVSDSLQAIRKHKFVNVLDDPGSADLSAYVDLSCIRHSAEEASEDVGVYGPVMQRDFLLSLGISYRLESLLKKCNDEQAEDLKMGYRRLVGDHAKDSGMGTQYFAMAIANKKYGIPAPFQ